MENNLLLVPIQVDSLFLAEDQLFAEPMAEFSRLPFFNGKRDVNSDVAYVSENFIAPPLQNRNQRFRAGLHLHWALPDPLTHGVHVKSEDESIRETVSYPAIPNRWLVHRELDSESKQWLVESNFLWPEERIYEELEPVREQIKRAIRLVRNFEALPEETVAALTTEEKIARLREVTNSLKNGNAELEPFLNDAEYSFFEGLFVKTQAMIARLEVAELDIENAGLDDLRPALSELLFDFFDRRRESISFPVRSDYIRTPLGLDSRLSELEPLIKNALRTANVLLQSWNLLSPDGRQNWTDQLELDLLRWLREPDDNAPDQFKFVEVKKITNSTADVNAVVDRVLAEPLKLVYEDSNTNAQVVASYPRFHRLTGDEFPNDLFRGAVIPDIYILKQPKDENGNLDSAAEALQLTILDDCFNVYFELIENSQDESEILSNVQPTADALLAALTENANLSLTLNGIQPFRYIGRRYTLTGNQFRENTKAYQYLNKLTILGYGEPTFAAFYPNCSSVLGFQDAEIGSSDTPGYYVLGWYDDAESEYLKYLAETKNQSGDLSADFLLQNSKWKLPNSITTVPQDTRIACFARILHSNGVEDASAEQDALAGDTNITLANTGREALAALLAHKVVANEGANASKIPQLEDQLESIFFMDALDQHRQDIGPKFQETRHAQGFNSVPGEQIFEIRAENVEATANTNLSGSNALIPALSSEVVSKLQTLNTRQRNFDQAVFQRDSLREQLFVDWYKYMLSAYPPQDSLIDYPDVDEVRFFVENFDIRPLLDLMYQTGQITVTPENAWAELGFAPLEGFVWETPTPNYFADLQAAQSDLQAALDNFNTSLAADIQRPDITDWSKLINLLSQPDLTPDLSDLFNELSTTEMGPALEQLQGLKTQILEALNAGWDSKDASDVPFVPSDIQLILGRYGQVTDTQEDLPDLTHEHIRNWSGLLAMLRQTNPASIQTEVDIFKNRLGDKTAFETNLNAYFAPGANDGPSMASMLEAADENLETMIDCLKTVVGSLISAIQNRNSLVGALPKAFRPAPSFSIHQISGPRFYLPKEPTVLIAGDLARASNRFARDGRLADGNLELLDWQYIPNNGTDESILAIYDTAIKPEIAANTPADLSNPDADYIGYYESEGKPWNPFMLEWSVELCPLQELSNARDGDYDADYILHNYLLKVNAVDMEEKPAVESTRGRNPNVYINRSLLTTQAFRSMEDQLTPYLDENDPAVLPTEQQNLDNAVFAAGKANEQLQNYRNKILAQSLSGFNAAMLMLQQNLQIPVDDPIGFGDYKNFTQAIAQLVGFGTKRSPNPLTDFSPIRTGKLQLNTMHLVDTFGRIANLNISDGSVLPSSLGTISGGTDTPLEMSVPPRLAVPARLHFRWISAEPDPELVDDIIPESVNDPSSTPICGWLMANQLDRSLVVFNAQGHSLGAIDSDAGTVLWRPAPGWESLTDWNQISNPHLKEVVKYLLGQTDSYIENFIDETNAVLRSIEPESFEQQQSLALLMGRPMAVVRANIDLEQKGVPAVHHGWNAFYRDRNDGNFKRETDEYTKVRYPVRIGAISQLNDGLIGYWLENNDEATFNSDFYLNNFSGNTSETKINFLADETPISQSLDPDDQDQSVCILMDPRAKVHAFTGILPVKEIDIPAEQYLSALQAIDITFLTTPMLTPAERISVPRPSESGYEWQWIEQASVKDSTTGATNWLEAMEQPTMPRSYFLNHFSKILYQQLLDNRWLEPGDTTAVPESDRPALAPEFTALKDELNKHVEEDAVVSVADLNPISENLVDFLLNENVGWLKVQESENPEAVYLVVSKEARKSSDFSVVAGSIFSGFEARVDAILNTRYLGFRPAVEDGQFFSERVWIREGWLKLQRKDS